MVHLLHKAYQESADTVWFNLFTRAVVPELRVGGATLRAEVDNLARKLNLLAEG